MGLKNFLTHIFSGPNNMLPHFFSANGFLTQIIFSVKNSLTQIIFPPKLFRPWKFTTQILKSYTIFLKFTWNYMCSLSGSRQWKLGVSYFQTNEQTRRSKCVDNGHAPALPDQHDPFHLGPREGWSSRQPWISIIWYWGGKTSQEVIIKLKMSNHQI